MFLCVSSACIAADSTSIPCLFRSLSFCLQLFPLFLKLGGGSGPECGPGLLHLGQRGLYSLLRPGQSIPVDGVVLDGASAVNEAALTGESVPVDKAPGDGVSAATVNCSGFLRCEATRVGEDTTLSQIIRMVSDAAATKAPIAKTADKVAGVFVPAVISIALVTTIVWLLLGREFSFALARGISVLVISCPVSYTHLTLPTN